MSENEAAVKKALKEAAKVCKTSLALLPEQSSISSSSSSSLSVTILPIHESLPAIFVDLLQSVRTQTTSVSLSFTPPITPDGALSYLPKLQDAVARLASCVVAAAGDDKHSARESMLVEDWATVARRVTEDVLSLIIVLSQHLDQPENWVKAAKEAPKTLPDPKTQATAPYLAHTASVWDTIDSSVKMVAATEALAAKRRWTLDMEAMTDAWTEYSEVLEDAEGEAGEDEEDERQDDVGLDEDDAWAGLEKELMGAGRMTPEELARAKKAKPILQLTRLLHRSIPKALPSHMTSFRPVLAKSIELAAAYDNAISTLYAPQEVEDISEAIAEAVSAARAIGSFFGMQDKGLEDSVAALALDGDTLTDRRRVEDFLKKWSPKLDEEINKWES